MPDNRLKVVQARRGQHAALMSNILKGLDEEQQRKLLALVGTDIQAMYATLPPEKQTPGAPPPFKEG